MPIKLGTHEAGAERTLRQCLEYGPRPVHEVARDRDRGHRGHPAEDAQGGLKTNNIKTTKAHII